MTKSRMTKAKSPLGAKLSEERIAAAKSLGVDPNYLTILASGPHGLTVAASVDPNTGTTWLHLRSYAKGPGAGSFIEFQTLDKDNNFIAALALNGGASDDGSLSGKVQGDLDIDVTVDGQSEVVGVSGSYGGQDPGIVASTTNLVLGNAATPFGAVGLKVMAAPGYIQALPGHPKWCVKIANGLVPLY